MSGYREHSFDPNAGLAATQRRPMRPFNWVQWAGVGFEAAAIAVLLLYGAGLAGWIPAHVNGVSPAIGLGLIGQLLINSRQDPADDPAPELAPARKRWLIIVTAVCVVVLGTATVITFLGV